MLTGVALFLGYNILWFFGKFFPYEKLYLMLLEKDSGSGVFLDGDYYAYSVKRPMYLFWMDGNIAVVNNQEARKGYDGSDPDNGDSIIIWLKPFTTEVGEMGRFLIKDDLDVTLTDCMDDILEELKVRSREITLDFDEGTFRIRTDDIIFEETFGHKLKFHLLEQSISMKRSITDMENTLREYGFVRAHKSYLVNLRHVRGISNYTMKLDTGDEVPVPRSRYAQIKREYATYRGGLL